MPKKKVSKKKKAVKFENLDRKSFTEGSIETQLQLSKIKDGETSWINIRTGKIKSEKYTEWKKCAWIPSNLDVSNWLVKLKLALYELFKKWYGKEIISEEDLIIQNNKIKTLEEQLFEERKKGEDMGKNFGEDKAKKELIKEVTSKRINYKHTLQAFEKFVEDSVKENKNVENEISEKIKSNRWILGLDCEVRAKNKNIDTQAQIDLHIINSFGQNRIIELKSPNKKIFKRKRKEGRFEFTSELSEAIGELLSYMDKTDFYSSLSQEGTYKIKKPSGLIIIGYNITKPHKDFLKQLNYHLAPHIKIITFNELIENCDKEISLIEEMNQKLT
ncbi:DUF4263 domain-containing protein [archaeon]|nr:DUF4263 domain-containing protein [archaeon]